MKPKNLKEPSSYSGTVNELIKFIPELAQITERFRDLLKKEGTWEWKEKHDLAFNQVQKTYNNLLKYHTLID